MPSRSRKFIITVYAYPIFIIVDVMGNVVGFQIFRDMHKLVTCASCTEHRVSVSRDTSRPIKRASLVTECSKQVIYILKRNKPISFTRIVKSTAKVDQTTWKEA